ncbi:hypothetical protein [Sporisorium scitamineum]|uniref:Uncharacterized protein n=1 Tax=Sporisorium scitamineum TaxID=49012 RepID=A0A0F7SCS7_9BASI|nr:hypothetical protein [Sporisorium scitamineum]
MRPFGHGGGSRHQQKGAQESSTSQAGTSSSSFVSTLSNALNISTPNASKTTASQTPVYPDAHLSAPAKLGYGEHALGSTSEALRTPTRSREPPPMLSLSGHEAFQSPNAPISPWNTNSMLEVPTGSFAATHGNGSFAGRPSTSAAPDQEWLLSGPSSGRYSNIFDTDPATTSSATATSSASSGSFREHPTRFDRKLVRIDLDGPLLLKLDVSAGNALLVEPSSAQQRPH